MLEKDINNKKLLEKKYQELINISKMLKKSEEEFIELFKESLNLEKLNKYFEDKHVYEDDYHDAFNITLIDYEGEGYSITLDGENFCTLGTAIDSVGKSMDEILDVLLFNTFF